MGASGASICARVGRHGSADASHPPSAPPCRQGGEFSACALRLAGFAGAVLGWSPDQFWRATPAEVAAVVGVLAGETTAPPGRDMVAAMMEAFPDG